MTQLLRIAFIIAFLFGHEATAQLATTDSAFRNQAAEQAFGRYQRSMQGQARLYNGPEFVSYLPQIKGHPFLDSLWQDGSVHYDGVLYEHIPLLYDLVGNWVVVKHPDGVFRIRLQSEKVQWFTLPGHQILRVVGDSTKSNMLKTGFYDQLYGGRSKVVARRAKVIFSEVDLNKLREEFRDATTFYVGRNGTYSLIKSKGALLNLFEDQKKALRKYARQKKLKFKFGREAFIVQLTQRYDELTR